MAFNGVERGALPTSDETVRDVIWSWAVREIAAWTFRRLDAGVTLQRFREINEAYPQAYVFKVTDGRVNIWPKADDLVQLHLFTDRAARYQAFFQSVVSRWCPDLSTTFCMSLTDGNLPDLGVPAFAFQKVSGDDPLLPDIDFIVNDYYGDEKFVDEMAYGGKAARAIFVGSTTGGLLTRQVVLDKSLPRLDAAEFFHGSSIVDFRLPSLVQYDSQNVLQMLAELPYCQPEPVSWTRQLQYRFLISMDGNGATCSRVLLALKSNSVLLKYESASKLYYFDALTPWTHYVPVRRHEDVERVLREENDHPGAFEHVSRAGRCFAEQYLGRDPVEYYTASLLRLYQGCFVSP